jgi:hypothetical protein
MGKSSFFIKIFTREMFKREVNLLENKTRINEFEAKNCVDSKQNSTNC